MIVRADLVESVARTPLTPATCSAAPRSSSPSPRAPRASGCPARLSRPLAPRASPSTRRAADAQAKLEWDAQAKQWYDPATRASQVEDLVANAQTLFTRVYPKGPRTALQNVLAGGTVSLAMIPEAVAFAFVAGVNPLVGLWSTVVLGLFAAALGGRAGMVSGASGRVRRVRRRARAAEGARAWARAT